MPKMQDDDLVMSLVELASGQPLETREAWLRSACEGDAELFSQVWDYVQWNHRMQDFLLEPLYPALTEHRFAPGELLADRFRIVREVAQGGMGIVYEARDEKLGRRIALKCAKSGFGRRLPPEVRHASEISHPHVCRIFEIHTASTSGGEIDFLTMEFLEGETLAARLSRGPLPEAEARTIGRQICGGLAEAHRNRVVHGDLKSNNVILSRDAGGGVRAVITDFGLAHKPLGPAGEKVGRAAGAAGSSQAGGTPDYMAPELWKGEAPSAASDVYALGVILYELAAGHRPYAPEIPWQDRLNHKPPAVQLGWDSIVQRCLDPDPARRFRDASEVAGALEPARSRRWWLGAVAAVVLAAVSGLVTYQRATAPKESIRLAVLPLESGPGSAELAERVLREAAGELARLKGGTRARLSIIPRSEVIGRHVDTVEKARSALGATHVVRGTLGWENGKVVVHAFLTDVRTQANSGDWKAEYAPGEVRYAAIAMAGMVTESLRLPAPAMSTVNAAAKQDYLAGLAYTRRNSTIDSALQRLDRAVAADPDSPLTWAGLAEAQYFKYFVTKDQAWLDRAAESLRQAQNRNPDLPTVHRVAGVLRYSAGLYQRAQEEYQRAIELEPNNGETYRRLGYVYDRNNRLDQSLEAYRKATQLDGNSVRACQSLGSFYTERDKNSEAARQFEKCVQLAPGEADAHYALGTAYSDLGRYPDAERELRGAIALKETPDALNNLAVALTKEGKDIDAIPEFIRALKLSPGQYLSWMNLGDAYRRTNRKEESMKAYRQALDFAEKQITRNPRDGLLRARLALVCARLGASKRAESEIGQALHDSPEDAFAQVEAVEVYEALSQRENALAILKTLPEQVLLDIGQYRDLADLRRDSRFQELMGLHHR
jgi:tetratricopeptide (TPR) repeat protein